MNRSRNACWSHPIAPEINEKIFKEISLNLGNRTLNLFCITRIFFLIFCKFFLKKKIDIQSYNLPECWPIPNIRNHFGKQVVVSICRKIQWERRAYHRPNRAYYFRLLTILASQHRLQSRSNSQQKC